MAPLSHSPTAVNNQKQPSYNQAHINAVPESSQAVTINSSKYGQYPSDFEPGYGAIGSSANASEGEDTLSGGFDDFDEDDEDEDEDVLVRGSDDPLTPKIKGSGPPTPAKPNKISNKISSKAAKILGEEAPPWFLLPDEGKGPQETGLVVDPEDKSVKGGSVKALVERLTAHDTTDPNYSKAFLMTFKSFTTLNDLFDLLVERCRIQPPSGLATLQLRQWTSRKRNIVQFRVINTFKSMLTDEDILEKDDLYILARMKELRLSKISDLDVTTPKHLLARFSFAMPLGGYPGSLCILHAVIPENARGNTPKVRPAADTILVPSRDDWILETLTMRDRRTENLGKASFVSEEDQEKLIKEMLALKMPRYDQKGTCRDYVTMVLKRLRGGGCIDDSVQKAYEKIYKEKSKHQYNALIPDQRKENDIRFGFSLIDTPTI
ncbi:cell division control protein [Lentinula edodes]|uniref:Cell division control protein n=1 Tax=Lentinula edodes TaxID=5353 RepID=A0A1Q3ECG8_LENED|nr:cell division control protein [Lentinula edodes]